MAFRFGRWALLILLTGIYFVKAFGDGISSSSFIPHETLLFWLCSIAFFVASLISALSKHESKVQRRMAWILAFFAFSSALNGSLNEQREVVASAMELDHANTRCREVLKYASEQSARIRLKVTKERDRFASQIIALLTRHDRRYDGKIIALRRKRDRCNQLLKEANDLREPYASIPSLPVLNLNSIALERLEKLDSLESRAGSTSNHAPFVFDHVNPSRLYEFFWALEHLKQPYAESILSPVWLSVWLTVFAHFLGDAFAFLGVREISTGKVIPIESARKREKARQAA